MEDLNKTYFNLLKQNLGKKIAPISLYDPDHRPDGNAIPYSMAESSGLEEFNVTDFDQIKNIEHHGQKINLNIIKMQAGLGSSVKRDDIVQKYAGRTSLGAKGTDLFFELNGEFRSVSELQLIQAISLEQEESVDSVTYTNLVNEETIDVVKADWEKSFNDKSFWQIFKESTKLHRGEEIFQKKMPTIGEDGELTTERMAPAGHGFVGVSELIKIFKAQAPCKITVIGNGEDLNSTPDLSLLHWVEKEKVPVVMITTTKTTNDLKGGQISLLKEGEKKFLTIVEKAQAEESGQLEYFEKLGLRPGDRKALFNTNIVVINEAALKEKFNLLGDTRLENFLTAISPDVISNKKVQKNKTFIQLESALGSVMLNLDRFFRREFDQKIVSVVNVSEDDREGFFIPVKNREDYDYLFHNFEVSVQNYRIIRKLNN